MLWNEEPVMDHHPLIDMGQKLINHLSPDLLQPRYREANYYNHLTGHCYVFCEALYHLVGKELDFKPAFIHHEGKPHWFLRRGNIHYDPTKSQFKTPVPYHLAKGKGFLTKQPSKRAQILIERMQSNEPARS